MSARETILGKVKTRMQTILTTNGYQTNAGSKVFVWKTDKFHEEEMPGINITDPYLVALPESTEGNYNKQTFELAVEIEGRCASGSTSIATARKLIADINKAVGTDLTWDGNAIHTVKSEGRNDELDVDETGMFLGGVLVRISILFRTTAWQGT
jgi:hypothetical protein